jgi:dihydropteroate synthase
MRLIKNSINFANGCAVMGILNVTPDSFSDGGEFLETEKAVNRALQMSEEGADIIDIGAESTRPGAEPVSAEEQIGRVIPVIKQLIGRVDVPLSIDTRNFEVAEKAVSEGVEIINDITAGEDKRMLELAGGCGAAVVLMHIQGIPKTMQVNPQYDDVVEDVYDYLMRRAECAEKAGIEKNKIFIDVGIGFGKSTRDNLLLLKHIDKFVRSGYPVLIGTSRKRFLGELTLRDKPAERIFATAATTGYCAFKGVSVVRVHDVGAMVDIVKVCKAIADS